MQTFQKIDGPFLRDPDNPKVIIDQWRNPAVKMLADAPIWTATEKIDGTNIRIGWDGYRISFGGRTDRADIPRPVLEHLSTTFFAPGIEEWFEENFPLGDRDFRDVVLFGEGYGPKIQSGGKYRQDVSFVGFDVFVDGVYLSPDNSKAIFQTLGVDFVPMVFAQHTLSTIISAVQADDFTSAYGNFVPEGLVARTIEPLYDQRGQRIIVKIKPDNLPT